MARKKLKGLTPAQAARLKAEYAIVDRHNAVIAHGYELAPWGTPGMETWIFHPFVDHAGKEKWCMGSSRGTVAYGTIAELERLAEDAGWTITEIRQPRPLPAQPKPVQEPLFELPPTDYGRKRQSAFDLD